MKRSLASPILPSIRLNRGALQRRFLVIRLRRGGNRLREHAGEKLGELPSHALKNKCSR